MNAFVFAIIANEIDISNHLIIVHVVNGLGRGCGHGNSTLTHEQLTAKMNEHVAATIVVVMGTKNQILLVI